MGSTPKAAASVTVAGRAPSATCRRHSASIPSAGAAASASWAHAPATLGTKEKTVKKVKEQILTPAPAAAGQVSSWHVLFYQRCVISIICTVTKGGKKNLLFIASYTLGYACCIVLPQKSFNNTKNQVWEELVLLQNC